MLNYINKIAVFIIFFGCIYNPDSKKQNKTTELQNTISVRNAHSMVYHSKESKVYLFGGANEKEVLSDLWVLNENHWEKVPTKNEPAPRTFASMSYDKKNDRIILFGGNKILFGNGSDSQTLLNDTWELKDNLWKKVITKNAPGPRAEAAITYDEHRNRIVLFGGYTILNKEYIKLRDTWEFYDNDWHLVSDEGPSQRNGASMIFNSSNKKVVLFGGSTIDKQYGKQKGETWYWDGKKWNKLMINQPAGIFNSSMIYNAQEKEIIRFGGWNGKSRVALTWTFQNDNWNILELDISPSPRNHCSMVYDSKNRKVILFGGHNGKSVFGDTWELKNHEWKKISGVKPIKRKKNGH